MPRMSFGEGLAAGFLDTFGNDLRQGFAEEEKADSLRKALERRQQMINQQIGPDALPPLPQNNEPSGGFLQNLGRALKVGRAPGSLTEPLKMEERTQDIQLKEYLRKKDEESKYDEAIKKLTFQEALRRGRPLRPEEEQKLEAQTRAATERGLTSQTTRQLREQQLKQGEAMDPLKIEGEKTLTALRKAQTDKAKRGSEGEKDKGAEVSLDHIRKAIDFAQSHWDSGRPEDRLTPEAKATQLSYIQSMIQEHNRRYPNSPAPDIEAPDIEKKGWFGRTSTAPGPLQLKPAAPKAPAFDVTADDIEQSYKNGTITKQERDKIKKELGY